MNIVPLDFLGQGALLTPADPKLHDMVIDYCKRELTEEVNLSQLAKVWVAVEMDGDEYKEVCGVFGYVLKPDVPLCRATKIEALRKLAQRYNDFLADNGARGKETTIHVARNEKPEQKCEGWKEVLHEWGAKLSDRVTVIVR